MARQSKKRKGPTQSTTLDQFFLPATKRSNQSSAAHSVETDVILISDIDEDLSLAKGKREERSKQDFSAIRLLGSPYTKRPESCNSKDADSADSRSSLFVTMGEHTSITRINTKMSSFTSTDEDMTSFGEPSTFLETQSPSRRSPPNERLQPSKDLPMPMSTMFDPCPGSQKSSDNVSMTQSFERTSRRSSLFAYPIQGGLSPAPTSNETNVNEDDTVKIDLLSTEVSFLEEGERVTTCPVCTSLLLGLSITDVEAHVCIDKLSTSSTPAASSLRTPSSTTVTPYDTIPPTYVTQPPTTSGGSNVFSMLMSSNRDSKAWQKVAIVENHNINPINENGGCRKAPFYKILQGMPIAVDAFRYGSIPGVTAYFLTHAHSDHYTNLASNWKSGPIYCSQSTANLIIHMLAVDPKWVHPLPMDIPSVIPNTNGVRVTLIEANHCPGSCLFLFEGPQTIDAGDRGFRSPFIGSPRTFQYLHCGDFRATPRHVLHPAIRGKQIDHVYLDNTYLNPKHNFPPQPQVISACAELAKRIVNGQDAMNAAVINSNERHTITSFMVSQNKPPKKQGKILFVVGTYSIGKERIVKAIAHALNTKVYCDERKAAILRCQTDPELDGLLVPDPLLAGVHIVPLSIITFDKLKIYMARFQGKYSRVIGFRPTGWTHTPNAGFEQAPSISSVLSSTVSRPSFTYSSLQPSRNSTSTLTLFNVPYSEHSSFFELTCFAMSLEWEKIIPTVNISNVKSRESIARWITKWQAEKKRRRKWQIIEYRELDYW